MNLQTGKFTAPRKGKGVVIGSGFSDETGTGNNNFETLSLQSTLNLQNGDQIWFQFDYFSPGSFLFGSRFTHFNGFLLEEEISQSYINV